MTACTLCELTVGNPPIVASDVDGEFCCRGCLAVYRLTGDGDDSVAASPAATTESPDADPDGEVAYLSIEGMRCSTCERFIEMLATDTPGIRDAQASSATEVMRVTYDPATIERAALPSAVSGFGYRAFDPAAADDGTSDRRFEFGRYRAVLATLLAMPVMVPYLFFIYPSYLGVYPDRFLYGSTIGTMVYVPLVIWSSLIVLGLGYPIFRGAYASLRVRQPTMDVLIALAVLAAYGYSLAAFVVGSRHLYFDVAVLVLVVVTVGNHVESTIKRRAIGTRTDLTASRMTWARRLEGDDSPAVVDLETCEAGDRILVKSGERIPLDGIVVDGFARVDEALVTGDSRPSSKSTGDPVVGGSIVTDGPLTVRVGDDASSTLDRLVELLWDVRSEGSGVQRLVDTFSTVFVPLVVTLAVFTAIAWLFVGQPWTAAMLIGLSVLVVSCPCSLGIATPLALAAGTHRASLAGTAILNPTVLERISGAEIVVFDKTGTLTDGEMVVEDVVAEDPDEVLGYAAAVEARSNHPVADAIASASPPSDRRVADFERTARSASATVDGIRVTVGHPDVFADSTWDRSVGISEAVSTIRTGDGVPTVVGWDGEVRGAIAVSDRPRANWEGVVSALASDGRRIVVLTGDDESTAGRFESHPDVDDVFAGVRPASKEAIVRRLRLKGTTVMVGDGTNDAPAIARADLGIALGGGAEIAIDAADAVVTNDDLESIPTVFEIARSTRRRIRQNLGWAVCYNFIAIPLAALGYIDPLVAAALMAGSSLLVVVNSSRGSLFDPAAE